MAIAHLISAEEYLHTSFEHDAEYVEGRIVYRPLPTNTHGEMQDFLGRSFFAMRQELGIRSYPEQRMRTQVNPPRYRVPDVCVTAGKPDEEVLTRPPLICIEVLSPDESIIELRLKIDEYLAFGVQYVWVIDPVARTGEIYTCNGIERVLDGKFRAGAILVDLNELEP